MLDIEEENVKRCELISNRILATKMNLCVDIDLWSIPHPIIHQFPSSFSSWQRVSYNVRKNEGEINIKVK